MFFDTLIAAFLNSLLPLIVQLFLTIFLGGITL